MTAGVELWLTIGVMALLTLGLRGSFILLGERASLPPGVQRALRFAPVAALAALVAPDVLLDGGRFDPLDPKLAAALVVIVIASRSRNPWLPFLFGMGVLLVLRKGLGW
ncbi:MAG: AzlD domain-containing protein [Rhodocyclaceae bacterium]|jgi:branched-subunit amino acid transport protein|nr:AzlD domain-containing protein [Rhodocyclaceae bacterium]MCL4757847.1 AzlD domain-containing protein [Rhodocyclaceae bacterium]